MSDTLFEFWDYEGITGNAAGNGRAAGQTFTPSTTHVLTSATFKVYRDTGDNDVTCSLYATSAGVPTGPALDVATLNSVGWNTSAVTSTLEEWVFTGGIELQGGVMYALAIEAQDSTSYGDARVVAMSTESTQPYTDGTRIAFNDPGWTIEAGESIFFEHGIPAPGSEPHETIYEMWEEAQNTGNAAGNLRRTGQTITPEVSNTLTRMEFKVYKDSNTKDVLCELFATDGGVPTGPALDTAALVSTADWPVGIAAANRIPFVFSGAVLLEAGVTYAITMYALDSTGYGDARLAVHNTSGTYPRGTVIDYDEGWASSALADGNFRQFGIGVADGGGAGGGGGPLAVDASEFESWGF